MTDDEITLVLKNRERAHLRLMAIEAITHDRLAEAMTALSQLVANPEPLTRGICRFCGCSSERACTIYQEDIHGIELVRCIWITDDETVCSNGTCVALWRRLNPDYVQTSAESRLVMP